MYPPKSVALSVVLALLQAADASASNSSTIAVSVPLRAPQGAHDVSRNLVSISIEATSFADWVGTTSKNTYFANALGNLASLTGVPPAFRIGGNSQDNNIYNPKVKYIDVISSSLNYVSANFFQLSKHLPSGTHMIWGLNFGANNASNALSETLAIQKAFLAGSPTVKAGVVLDALELGNESDFYGGNGHRPNGWNIDLYLQQWTATIKTIIDGARLDKAGSPSIILGSFGGDSGAKHGFSPETLLNAGLKSGPLGKHFNTLSQHQYEGGDSCSGAPSAIQSVINPATIRRKVAAYDPDIKAVNDAGIQYIMGEANSESCGGADGISNVGGAALWLIDYALQAASHNIQRIHLHHCGGCRYNTVQPIPWDKDAKGNPLPTPTPPVIAPPYYGALVAASFVGSSQNGRVQNTQVIDLGITNTTNNLAAYAAFDDGKLARAVVLNMNSWTTLSKGARPSTTFSLSVGSGSDAPKKVQVRQLEINHADDRSGLKWAGRSYETKNALPTGRDTYSTVGIKNGSFPIKINNTGAVLLTFEY